MDDHEQRLSRIDTIWTLVRKAREGPAEQVGPDVVRLWERYAGAARRYLLGALKGREDAADDLYQEFCLRFLRNDFRNVTPDRGRFRDYVKATLVNLLNDHWRHQQKRPEPLRDEHLDHPEMVTGPTADWDSDRWRESWCQILVDRARSSLAAGGSTDQVYHQALRLRDDHPDWSSAELAAELGRLPGGQAVEVGAWRTRLSRARDRLADLLLQEVCRSLGNPTRARLHEELIDLGLFQLLQAAMKRTGLV